jgi:chaperonin GroES
MGDNMRLEPLYDQILVVPEKKETETEGGIILPESAKQLLVRAKVVAMGKGSRYEGGRYEMDCKVGDTILVNARCGVPYIIEGREHRIIKDYEVLGVIHE